MTPDLLISLLNEIKRSGEAKHIKDGEGNALLRRGCKVACGQSECFNLVPYPVFNFSEISNLYQKKTRI